MKKIALVAAVLLSMGALPACIAGSDDPEAATDSLDEAANPNAPTYFIVTRVDTRKCMNPICGGYFVKRVNHTKTKCADGSMQTECHMLQIDFDALGLSEDEAAKFEDTYGQGLGLVQGNLERVGNADTLVATEAWVGISLSDPSGTFYRVDDSGVKCIAAPCPSFKEAKLNSSVHGSLASVDLAASGANEKQIDAGFEELFASGLLVAGHHETVTGPAGNAKELVASEFYSRVQHVESTGEGQFCGGFGGIACPDGFTCVDDPNDSCDADNGGADCGGTCTAAPADPCGGCESGRWCSFCWGSYACIPEGAVC